MINLDKFVEENYLSMDSIKQYVDDYSIFSHYIGEELELGRKYSSPLRYGDNDPSFCLYEVYGDKYKDDGTIIFKDHATKLKGNVFKFVQLVLSKDKTSLLPYREIYNQINHDFDLGFGIPKTFKPRAKIIDKAIVKKEPPKIEIVSKSYTPTFLNYFTGKYDISENTLIYYNTFNVSSVYYKYKTQETKIVYPKSICIAYKIGKYYKIYMPFEDKKYKFRNDFPPNYVEGFIQLKYKKPFVIITKALKEIMFFREHFDIDSVAGKSENIIIPEFLMQKLFDNYETVYLWLDRDTGGKEATESYLKKYGDKLKLINYPEHIKEKDPTDRYEYMKSLGKTEEALSEIRRVIINSTLV